ncbi:MAG: DNA-binding response regulator [Acidobacteria bacterium]|nr:MAG: DNA-binding response regulator [Acidobacteriota bacterium]REK01620.1 MAG: DNA-binding response regulator [Acidobacteriota bacterium]REK14576.1 MAG: DNA-binding response regulator [Acidobacteriota bacterium]REK45291.1 MAG: DNA-binding response regulator [Acidobacteriota bacterium]
MGENETREEGTKRNIRVAIVEDKDEIRFGLSRLIGGSEGFECIGEFGNMEDALEELPTDLPDVLLNDLGLPGMSGSEGISILRSTYPDLKVLILTVFDDDDRIIDGICAGASGYLLKSTPMAEILESIREIDRGGAPMSPQIAKRVMELFRTSPPPKKVDYDLTPHETRILKMLVDGHNYKTAAEELRVSVNTVSFHVKKIYEKLHVHSKSEAVAKALKGNIVS